MAFIARQRTLLLAGAVVWIALVAWGFWRLIDYETTPGDSSSAPAAWPRSSALARPTDRATLLMFVHPHCPCSRASLDELDRLLAHCDGRVATTVVFVKPAGSAEGWETSDLWRTAAAIPGVVTRVDPDGAEALRFHARTSGNVVVYDAAGKLVFSGGITATRGHSGDNDGRSSILSLLMEQDPERRTTPVFGCPLFSPGGIEEAPPCDKP